MAELLIECLSEEIPARLQPLGARRLADDLKTHLADAGIALAEDAITPFWAARRIGLVATGLPARQPDVREERRGPRVDAPDAAIAGFLKSVGLAREALQERSNDKGTYLYAVIERQGRPMAEIVADILPALIRGLAWPKSMRWGAGTLAWVRPLHRVLCLFDGRPITAEIGDGLVSGGETAGHRFMAPDAFAVKDFADYERRLEEARVVVDPARRRQRIVDGLATLETGALVIERHEALLDEVSGLVEWPVALLGKIDAAYMDVPPEVLISAMRRHQKYFPVRDAKTGALAPYFALIANLESADNGRAIINGNERVLRARLADARFFWDHDRAQPLESRVAALDGVVFHARLGSMGEKVKRIEALAGALAPYVPGTDEALARRAARLAKADLTTEMVGEFPDLQGVMGRYYAAHDGEPDDVARAIAEHYAPAGPDDACPSAPTSVCVALADRLDSLVGFFSIGLPPTGSKDPFALRRAALGVIRLIVENSLRLPLRAAFGQAAALYGQSLPDDDWGLLAFIAERLRVHLRREGVRHDLIAAVFARGDEDDLVRLLARVRALEDFLASDDGANLLTAYRRAANIVRIEEKKDGVRYDGRVDEQALCEAEEIALFRHLQTARAEADAAMQEERFAEAMAALARLRRPVDVFFDEVTVNCEQPELRANRLHLLAQIRATLNRVADFSHIEG